MSDTRDTQKATVLNAQELAAMYAAIDKIRAKTGDRNYSESAFIRDAIAEKAQRCKSK